MSLWLPVLCIRVHRLLQGIQLHNHVCFHLCLCSAHWSAADLHQLNLAKSEWMPLDNLLKCWERTVNVNVLLSEIVLPQLWLCCESYVVLDVALDHQPFPSSLHWHEWLPSFYCLFPLLVFTLTVSLLYSLTLVDSSLPSEAEPELRTYISRRLSKGALLGGMGNIATVELRQLLLMLLVPFVNPYFFFKRYDKMHLFVAVSQRRPLAATAVSWSTNGLQNNQTLMEMDTSFASWVALKRAWTYILHPKMSDITVHVTPFITLSLLWCTFVNVIVSAVVVDPWPNTHSD